MQSTVELAVSPAQSNWRKNFLKTNLKNVVGCQLMINVLLDWTTSVSNKDDDEQISVAWFSKKK